MTSASRAAAGCHLGALLLQGLLVTWPSLGHYIMADVAKGTDGSSASRAAPVTRRGCGAGPGDAALPPAGRRGQRLLLGINRAPLQSARSVLLASSGEASSPE